MYESESKRSRKSISLGPILIIILGIIFLLNNFGVLPWEIWQNIWKFWPILLILFGIEVLLGRNSAPKTVFFLIGLIFLLPILLILNPLTGNPLATETLRFDKPLGNLTKAEFVFDLPSNNLKVVSLEKTSDRILKTSVKYSKLLPKPEIVEDRKFDEAKYTFTQPEKYLPFSGNLGNTVELNLSPLVPTYLFIKGNAGVFILDLEQLNVYQLEIDSGASQIDISYNKVANTKTYIKATAAQIRLKIPTDLEAQLKIDSLVKDIKLDSKRFTQKENIYTTANYGNVTNRIQIEISGSASSVEIK